MSDGILEVYKSTLFSISILQKYKTNYKIIPAVLINKMKISILFKKYYNFGQN